MRAAGARRARSDARCGQPGVAPRGSAGASAGGRGAPRGSAGRWRSRRARTRRPVRTARGCRVERVFDDRRRGRRRLGRGRLGDDGRGRLGGDARSRSAGRAGPLVSARVSPPPLRVLRRELGAAIGRRSVGPARRRARSARPRLRRRRPLARLARRWRAAGASAGAARCRPRARRRRPRGGLGAPRLPRSPTWRRPSWRRAFLAAAFFAGFGSSGCSGRVRPSRMARRRTMSAYASLSDDEWLFTGTPSLTESSTASALVMPSSLASSCTRMFFGHASDQPFLRPDSRHLVSTLSGRPSIACNSRTSDSIARAGICRPPRPIERSPADRRRHAFRAAEPCTTPGCGRRPGGPGRRRPSTHRNSGVAVGRTRHPMQVRIGCDASVGRLSAVGRFRARSTAGSSVSSVSVGIGARRHRGRCRRPRRRRLRRLGFSRCLASAGPAAARLLGAGSAPARSPTRAHSAWLITEPSAACHSISPVSALVDPFALGVLDVVDDAAGRHTLGHLGLATGCRRGHR